MGKALHDRDKDGGRFGHTARSKFTTGHGALVRSNKADTVASEGRDIALGGGMVPHPHIHGRGHQDGLIGGQQGCGRQIIGQAIGRSGHQVCGRRGYHHQIGRARKLDMAHLGLIGQREQLLIDPIFGQGR